MERKKLIGSVSPKASSPDAGTYGGIKWFCSYLFKIPSTWVSDIFLHADRIPTHTEIFDYPWLNSGLITFTLYKASIQPVYSFVLGNQTFRSMRSQDSRKEHCHIYLSYVFMFLAKNSLGRLQDWMESHNRKGLISFIPLLSAISLLNLAAFEIWF